MSIRRPSSSPWRVATENSSNTSPSTFGVQGYEDYKPLLDRENVDIVFIAAPVSEIPEITVFAAAAGKHMVLGKPMAMTIAQADEMVAAVEKAGVSCFPFQGIHRLLDADLKARVEKGEIGELIVMHQTNRWSIAEDWYNSGTPGWFVDPKPRSRGRVHRRGDLRHRLSLLDGRERHRRSRGPDGQSRAQGHRGRGLGHGDVHIRQRDHRHARGLVDDQLAAEDEALAEGQ